MNILLKRDLSDKCLALVLSISMLLTQLLPGALVSAIILGTVVSDPQSAAAATSVNDGFDPNADGDVYSIATQDDGKVIAGGQFTNIGGAARNYIARLNPDGTADATFNPNANDFVGSTAIQADGKILIGGDFTTIDGQGRSKIARLNADGTLDSSFNPTANNSVRHFAFQSDGKIIITGDFTSVSGQTRNYIARLNIDGSLDTEFNPNASSNIFSLALQSDDKIIIGGNFSLISGIERNYIARLNPDGSLDTSFDPNADGQLNSIAIQADGKIIAGGSFSIIGGQSRSKIARLNIDGTADTSFTADANSWINSTAIQADGKILIGGDFTTIDGQGRSKIARLNANGSLDTAFNPNADAVIDAISVQGDGNIIIGGIFSTIGGITRNRIGRLNADGSLDITFDPNANNSISSTAIQADGKILIGGQFTTIGGIARNNIARLNADGSLDTEFNPNANGVIRSIAIQADGKILIGGQFTTIGGIARNYVARLNADGSLDTEFNPSPNNMLNSIVIQADGKILLGGQFTAVGVVVRNRIARLNGDGSLDNEFVPNASNMVNSLAIQADGKILVGGSFMVINGVARARIARLGVDGSLDNAFDPNANNQPYTIAVQADGKILVGGLFTTIGGQARNKIARLNIDGSVDSFNPNANDYIFSMGVQTDGKILIGGNFTTVGGVARNYIARLNADGSLDNDFNLNANGIVRSLAIQNDGKVLIGGQFTNMGGVARNYIARISADAAALQDLAVSGYGSTVTWMRSQSSPEIFDITFEYSTDLNSWIYLGAGTRITGGWQLTGLSLPLEENHYIRARGKSYGGLSDASASVVESIKHSYILPPDETAPTTTLSLSPPEPNGSNYWYRTVPTVSLWSNESGTKSYSWNTTASFNTYTSAFSAPQGSNTLYYYSSDLAENMETFKSEVLKVDTEQPTVNIVLPAEGQTVGKVVDLDVQVSGEGGSDMTEAVYLIDSQTTAYQMNPSDGNFDSPTENVTAKINTFLLENGSHTISVLGKDEAGNWSEPSSVNIITKNYPLTAEITYPDPENPETSFSGTIHIKGTADYLNSDKFSKYVLEYQKTHLPNGTEIGNPVWKSIINSKDRIDDATLGLWNTTGLVGKYKLRLTTFDINGNRAADTKYLKIDNIKPEVMPLQPKVSSIVTSALEQISIAVTDYSAIDSAVLVLNDKIKISSFDEGTGYLTYASLEEELVHGINTVTVVAKDKAGIKNPYAYSFIYEPLGPSAEISGPEDGATIPGGKRTPVFGTAYSSSLKSWKLEYKKEPAATYTSVVTGSKPTMGETTFGSLPTLSSGTYKIRLSVINNALVVKSDEVTVSVDSALPYSSATAIDDVEISGNSLVSYGSISSPGFASYKLFLKQTYPSAGSETLIHTGYTPINNGLLGKPTVKGNGTYNLILRQYDSLGMPIASDIYEDIELDTAKPGIKSIYPKDTGFTGNSTPPIMVTAADPEPVKGANTKSGLAGSAVFKVDGISSVAPIASSAYLLVPAEPLSNGSHKVLVRVADIAGNITSKTFTFTVDTSKPVTEITNLSDEDLIKGTYLVKGNIYDEYIFNYQLQYRLDSPSSSWAVAASGTQNVPVDGATIAKWNTSKLNGDYYARLVATDKAGNRSYYPAGSENNYQDAIKIRIDNKAPSLGAIYPIDKSIQKNLSSLYVSGAYDLNPATTSESNVSGINAENIVIKIYDESDDASFDLSSRKITYDLLEPLEDGSYTAIFTVPDVAGNIATKKTTFTIDSIDPTASISLPVGSIKGGNKLTIPGKATDKNMSAWTLYQSPPGTTAYSKLASGTKNIGSDEFDQTLFTWVTPKVTGLYDLKLTVVDKAGNSKTSDVASITIDNSSGYANKAEITYPSNGQILKGKVPVIGSATTSQTLAYYKVFRKLSTAPISQYLEIYKGTSPVEGGSLALFNATALDGQYDLLLKTYKDPSLPAEQASSTITNLKIDNKAPVISKIGAIAEQSGIAGYIRNLIPIVKIEITENGVGVDPEKTKAVLDGTAYALDFGEEGNAVFNEGENSIFVTLPGQDDGKHSLSIAVGDMAGNTSKIVAYPFVVDTDNLDVPTQGKVEILSPLEATYRSGTIPVVGKAFDVNLLSYTLSYRKAASVSYTQFYTAKAPVIDATLGMFKAPSDGEYEIKLSVFDKALNSPKEASVNLVVDNTTPIAAITKINNVPVNSVTTAAAEITITGKAYDRGGLPDGTDPNDSFEEYVIDYGFGSAPASWTVVSQSSSFIGTEAADGLLGTWDTTEVSPKGTYVLRVRTFDKAGNIKEFKKSLKIK